MWQTLTDELRMQQLLLEMSLREWTAGYAADGGRIFCSKGCRGCCTLAVGATFTEARAIAAGLPAELAARVDDYVARLLALRERVTDLTSFLRLHRREIGSCPFLDDAGACAVYSRRPFACRALLATRESSWCAVDFAKLPAAEKQAFMASLDPAVAAFPTHYAAVPRRLGEEFEALAKRRMAETFGFALSGNLPLLVHLERDRQLSALIATGYEAAAEALDRFGVTAPYLLLVERHPD